MLFIYYKLPGVARGLAPHPLQHDSVFLAS